MNRGRVAGKDREPEQGLPSGPVAPSLPITRICECCGREQEPDAGDWPIGRDGEDYCPECAESLAGELQRLIDKLPRRIALCPQCAPEFYYPLRDGEGLSCPTPGCHLEMIVYDQKEAENA